MGTAECGLRAQPDYPPYTTNQLDAFEEEDILDRKEGFDGRKVTER
jgi:hypothetical protein